MTDDLTRARLVRSKATRAAANKAWADQFSWNFEANWTTSRELSMPRRAFGVFYALVALVVPPVIWIAAIWLTMRLGRRRGGWRGSGGAA